MTSTLATRVDNNIVNDINYLVEEENSDKSSVVREILLEGVKRKLIELALDKYSKRKVSLGKAAELAKLPLADFMKVAAERKIPLNYSVQSLKKDFLATLK